MWVEMRWKLVLGLLLVLLPGCVGDHKGVFMPPAPAPAPTLEIPHTPAGRDVEVLQKDITASNNATQQSLTGLGLQMGKVAESFKLMDALANFKAEVKAALTANVSATVSARVQADLEAKLEIKNQMTASLQAEVNGLKIENAHLSAQAGVQANAMLALKAENHQLTQNTSAGRDSTVITFTSDMAKTIVSMSDNQVRGAERAQWATVAIIICLCSALAYAYKTSRDREVNRHTATRHELEEHKGTRIALVRCTKAPPGWRCNRGAGHDGPCAAVPLGGGHGT